MELDGGIIANLAAARASAERLRGHPVHRDTVSFWRDLVAHARREISGHDGDATLKIRELIGQIEAELAERRS